MAELRDFERYVTPFISDVPIPAIHDALLDAAIEFCIRTKVMRELIEPITLVRNTAEYEVEPLAPHSQCVEVMHAWLPHGEIAPATRPDLDAFYPRGWVHLSVGSTAQIRHYYCPEPSCIRLVPAPSNTAKRALQLEIAYAPCRDAQCVPDILFNRYVEYIAAGALFKLHQHAASYADANSVSAYGAAFNEACSRFADDAAHGFSHQPLRVIAEDI